MKSASGVKTLTIILSVILLSSARAQFSVQWIKYCEGPGMAGDMGNVVKTDSKGFIYAGGYIRTSYYIGSEDYCLVKYTSDGGVVWQKTYNGPGDCVDEINDLETDDAGNVYVTGESFGENSLYDFCTIKYDREGNIVWIKRYDNCEGNDEALKILLVDSAGIYVSGISENAQENFDICLIKYTAGGNEEWVKRYDGSGVDIFSAMSTDTQGHIYLAGASYNGSDKYDICLLKYSPEGNLIFAQKFDRGYHEYDIAHSIAVNNSDDIYIAGRSKNTNGDYDCTLLKYSSSGNLIWQRFYDGTGHDYDQASSVCIDNNDNVVITGWSWGDNSSDDFITIKYNSSGDRLWTKRYDNIENGQSSSDGAGKIICDNNGNLYVMGVSNNDYLLIKYDPSGNEIYRYRFDGEVNGMDEPKDMCFGKYNSIIITGFSEHYIENTDICTIKINNTITSIHTDGTNVPAGYSLSQNYPNPFNPSTTISFSIANSSNVKLVVYDITGKAAATLLNEKKNAGTYEIIFNASNLSSGTYFYKLETDGYTCVKKMILVK